MRGIEEFIREEDGIGVVEIILILVVLIGLIAIFKTKMSSLIKDILLRLVHNGRHCNAYKRKYDRICGIIAFTGNIILMALLEGARARGLNTCAELVSDVAIHSVCAEYQPVLWEDYKLLMLDGTYGT